MKIMAFVGSPRKKSNVDILIDKVIEGAESVASMEVEKIYLYEGNVQYCNGCLACTALKGSKDCHIKDDLNDVIRRMPEVDAYIFGTPNHVHSMSPALTNLFSRMQPLIKMDIVRDSSGKIVTATSTTLIRDKRAVMVVSQGDFSPSQSALILRAVASNLADFKLKKIAEVFGVGNLEKAQVKDKEGDLHLAFNAGVKLAQ